MFFLNLYFLEVFISMLDAHKSPVNSKFGEGFIPLYCSAFIFSQEQEQQHYFRDNSIFSQIEREGNR